MQAHVGHSVQPSEHTTAHLAIQRQVGVGIRPQQETLGGSCPVDAEKEELGRLVAGKYYIHPRDCLSFFPLLAKDERGASKVDEAIPPLPNEERRRRGTWVGEVKDVADELLR